MFNYANPIKYNDFNSVAKYISKIERPNEPILLYRNGLALPFKYSYHGSNPLVALPHNVTFDSNYLINIKDETELNDLILSIKTYSNSYLLITDDNSEFLYSLNMNRKMFNDYISAHFTTTVDTLIFGESIEYFLRIRRLEKH